MGSDGTSREWSSEKSFWLDGCAPLFFARIASKGLSQAVSLLFTTLAGRLIRVAAKGLKAIVGTDQRTVVSERKTRKVNWRETSGTG